MSRWIPIGPDYVFTPRDPNFTRLSRRGEYGRSSLVSNIVIDPTDSSTIYTVETPIRYYSPPAYTAFRTNDNGNSWTPLVDSLQINDPTGVWPLCIAVHPVTTTTIYMGTNSGRVYTSSNQGDTWNSTYGNIGSGVVKIFVDPRTATNVSTTAVIAVCDNGIWRSNDGASTFIQVLNEGILDAAVRYPTDGSNSDYYACSANGLFHATDPKATTDWTNLTTSTGSGLPTSGTFNYALLDICWQTPRPYAWFFHTVIDTSGHVSEHSDVLCTAPGPGSSWTTVNSPSLPDPNYWLYAKSFGVAPNSPGDGAKDVLLFGNVWPFRSLDAGDSWTPLNQNSYDPYHADCHTITFYPATPDPGTIPATYIGCDGGLAMSVTLADPSEVFPSSGDANASANNFDTYDPNSVVFQNLDHGKQTSAMYAYNSDPAIGTLGYIGCQDTGIQAGDSALLWRGIFNADGGQVAVKQGSDGVKVWFRQGQGYYFYVTTDQGQFFPGQTNVLLPDSRFTDCTSNLRADNAGNCIAGIVFNDYPATTSAFAVTPGTQSVTPGNMDFINNGTQLAIWSGNTSENVIVTAVAANTFTATFVNSYPANANIRALSYTSIAAAFSAGVQTVQPGTMNGISTGVVLTIDSGDPSETVVVTGTTSTTFTATFSKAHGQNTTVSLPFYSLVKVDGSGSATPITQNFAPNSVGVVAVHPSNSDIVCFSTSDQKLFTTTNATASFPTWTQVTFTASASISALAITSSGKQFVLFNSIVPFGSVEFPKNTPLASVAGTSLVGENCDNIPPTGGYGNLVIDPVKANTLYATSGSRVYQLSVIGEISSSYTWTDISDGLPGPSIIDLWVGNVGTPSTPLVLLRAAAPRRGMWEKNVTSGATDQPLALYVRDNFMDMGRLPTPPDGVPSPYHPADSSQTVYHYECADIKVDSRQISSSGVPYFRTDPEGTFPLSHVLFDQLKDNSDALPSENQAMVHVQVRNRGLSAAKNVKVWVLYANAGSGLPPLNLTASGQNKFDFWNQFTASGQILPNTPGDSPWQPVGAPMTMSGITPSSPQVASWPWTIPTLGSGDPGHYCLIALVHGSGAMNVKGSGYDVDVVTPNNKQVGQKNLHIGPPLPAHQNRGGNDGNGPAPGDIPMYEYIEFWNPILTERVSDLVWDLTGLPAGIQVSFQLPPIVTVNPLPGSISGVVSISGSPGVLNGCHHGSDGSGCKYRCHKGHKHCDKHKFNPCFPCPELHKQEHCVPFCHSPTCAGCGPACSTKPCHKCSSCSSFFSQFTPIIYTAKPTTVVTITGVKIPAQSKVSAYFNVRSVGTLVMGHRYRMQVKQIVGGKVVGGSVYIVRAKGMEPFEAFPRKDLFGKEDDG